MYELVCLARDTRYGADLMSAGLGSKLQYSAVRDGSSDCMLAARAAAARRAGLSSS